MPFSVGFIDDEKDLCDLFADTYAQDEVVVRTFTQPSDAVAEFKTNPPDLLFVDYRLPGTDGVQLAKSLRLEIPMVLLTGEIEVNPDFNFYKIIYKPDLDDEIGKTINDLKAQKGA